MAQLPRIFQKIFGATGATGQFGKIGSKAAGSPVTTKDLDLMQELTEYDQGLSAIISDQGVTKLPRLQDINSLHFLSTSQISYLMQSGIPEWNAETEYYEGVSLVLHDGEIWIDTYDTPPNLNFEPSTNLDKWRTLTSSKVDFESDNLIINVQTSDEVGASAGRISMLNDSFIAAFKNNLNVVFDTTLDVLGGLALKASHLYQLWISVAYQGGPIIIKMAPDLTGTADADVLNSLSDSGATFQTDLVTVDSEIYQLDDKIKGFVKAISSENVITCKDADGNDLDLFPLGTESYIIRIMSPAGLGEFKARIGAASSNSGANLDNSTYTQIQEEKDYNGDGSDFVVSAPQWTTIFASMRIRQVNDWTGKGKWIATNNVVGTEANNISTLLITTAGIVYEATVLNKQHVPFSDSNAAAAIPKEGYVTPGSNTITILFSAGLPATSEIGLTYEAVLGKKPTFHN